MKHTFHSSQYIMCEDSTTGITCSAEDAYSLRTIYFALSLRVRLGSFLSLVLYIYYEFYHCDVGFIRFVQVMYKSIKNKPLTNRLIGNIYPKTIFFYLLPLNSYIPSFITNFMLMVLMIIMNIHIHMIQFTPLSRYR